MKINLFYGDKLETQKTLAGHELASTSVDWKRDTLVTISDDRQIRVYKMPDAEYLYSLWTKDTILEWHTLTYASLAYTGDNSAVLGVTTQNGYLFIFELVDGKFMQKYARKISTGGLEAFELVNG